MWTVPVSHSHSRPLTSVFLNPQAKSYLMPLVVSGAKQPPLHVVIQRVNEPSERVSVSACVPTRQPRASVQNALKRSFVRR